MIRVAIEIYQQQSVNSITMKQKARVLSNGEQQT